MDPNKISKKKKHFMAKILKEDLPKPIEEYLLHLLRRAYTPEHFCDLVWDLQQRLDIFKGLDEEYRENWHSIHCSCNECLKLEEEEE